MKHIIIGIDVDDTLTDTYNYLNRLAKQEYGDHTELAYGDIEGDSNLNWQFVKDGLFMKNAPVIEGLIGIVDSIPKLLSEAEVSYDVVCITHRGMLPVGYDYTRDYFNDNNINLDVIHILDPKQHPDKIEYLKDYYTINDSVFVLIDDNPIKGKYSDDEYVILIDAPHNKSRRDYDRAKDTNEVLKFLSSKLEEWCKV